jgi:uncharacterized membrane protein
VVHAPDFIISGMIESPVVFAAVLLLLAGVFPMVAAQRPWRLFEVVPPIVLSYLVTTCLAVAGFWKATPPIAAVQEATLAHLMPPLVFALVVRCDLRAVAALGPRVLAGFACATASILSGIVVAWMLWRPLLPTEAWRGLAAVGSGWVGGTANLVAVASAIETPADIVALALLTDTLCYTLWVVVLFGSVPLAARFNAWSRAMPLGLLTESHEPESHRRSAAPGDVLVWLGMGLLVGAVAALAAARMPVEGLLTKTSWTLLFVTGFGIVAALTPLRRLPGAEAVASGLLAVIVVTMASRGSFAGLTQAPTFVAAGLTALAFHALVMVLAARLFRFDLALCGIASLANVGGVGSAPLLAAAHAPGLAPLGVLLALLGYTVGTVAGLGLAKLLAGMALRGGT